MYNLLVVDDEKFAVKGITIGIDWSDVAFANIYEAMDVQEAKQLLTAHKIDVMVSDIEMPGANGLDLQEWVRVNSPHTETIFLTGHANFAYAQQAIRLGSFDYVLKPVDHDRLKDIVKQALEKVRAEEEQSSFTETYKTYYSHWVSQLPILVERFWQDLLSGRIPMTSDRLQRGLQLYDIPLQTDSWVLPILISVEHWKEELNARDEEIMEYAVRKAAAEIILDEHAGSVIQENGSSLALVYMDENDEGMLHKLKRKCETYIQACNSYFQCSLSCYIGEAGPLERLTDTVGDLFTRERSNVTKSNCVLLGADADDAAGGSQSIAPAVADWLVLLEAGKKQELLHRVQESIERMQAAEVGPESVEGFYYGLLHTIYHVFHKKGLSVHEMLAPQELQDYTSATRSVNQLKNWALRVLSSSCDYLSSHQKGLSAVIGRVRAYVDEHLHEELSREEIAASVYLNPAYLSRLFKKETGLSISEYILKIRMEQAKKLLAESNDKISYVAEKIGYSHFSFFAKMFKKYTGFSPQEYRKSFQGTSES